MKKRLFLQSKWPVCLCGFLLPFFLVQIFFALCGIYPYGTASVLTGDLNTEFINFYAYFVNLFHTPNDLSYMLTKTIGGEFQGLASFLMHDPLMLVLLLFPGEKIALGVELLFTLQVSLAGFSAAFFLNSRYKRSLMSLVFSTGYALCGYFFGYFVLTIYFSCLAIVPLVLYFFLAYLDGEKDSVAFIFWAALLIFINYQIGFTLAVFLVLIYVSRIIEDPGMIRRLPGVAFAGICAGLLCGFFLVPTAFSLIGEKSAAATDFGLHRTFDLNRLFAQFLSGTARNEQMPLICCSVAALFFCILFFFSRAFSLRQKLAAFFVIFSLCVSMWLNGLNAIWHGFVNPDGFWWRYSFYLSFVVIVLGYRGFLAWMEEESVKKRVLCALAAPALILVYVIWQKITGNIFLDRMRLLVNAAIVILILAGLALCLAGSLPAFSNRERVKKILMQCGLFLIFAITAADLLYSANVTYMKINSRDGALPQMSTFIENHTQISDAVAFVQASDPSFYRMEKDFDRSINDPSMFGYVGLSHGSSCEKREVLDWMANFGICRSLCFANYNGGSTSLVDALFSIRYLISRFDTIEKPYVHQPYEGTYHVYKNDHALPFAFVAPSALQSVSLDGGNTFEKQNRIAASWGDFDTIYYPAEYECVPENCTQTGNGIFSTDADDQASVTYRIKITGDDPLYLYFAAPGNQEAELFVDGESQGAYFSNNRWRVLNAGRYPAGETLDVSFRFTGSLAIDEPCFYYEDRELFAKWAQAAADLNKEIGPAEEITSSHFRFRTRMPENAPVVVSIPSETAWQITCDGEEIVPGKTLGMLLCLEIPGGDHLIEMQYRPQGQLTGLLLTLTGITLLSAGFFVQRLKAFRAENTDKEDKS